MVNLLVRLHPHKQVRLHMRIGPADVEVEVVDGLSLKEPFILLGHVLDHRVLSV